MSHSWGPVHHKLLKIIRDHNHLGKTFLLGFSGGRDSCALAGLLLDLKVPCELIHIHHGENLASKSVNDRDRAQNFASQWAKKNKLKIHLFKSSHFLKSEQEMRDFRIQCFKKFRTSHIVTLAHHQDDLLETRFMRLIRGTGPSGLMAMKEWQGFVFRPLLSFQRSELEDYLKKNDLKWVEDPSNQKSYYFRNFLRHQILRKLEDYRPGSLKRMARTLDSLALAQTFDFKDTVLKVKDYLTFGHQQQIQVLALLLKNNGIHEFGLSQLKEVQKQLDKAQKHHTFKCAGVVWSVNAQQISLGKY